MMSGYVIGAAIVVLSLAACGQNSGDVSAGRGSPSEIVGGSAPSETTGIEDKPTLVAVTPGLANVQPAGWTEADVLADGRQLLVHFWADPCTGVDRVDVRYRVDRVTVTLYQGIDPERRTGPCAQIAEHRAVRVPLAEPLDGRQVVDGAAGQGDPSTMPTPL
jgi:hypothetical protein